MLPFVHGLIFQRFFSACLFRYQNNPSQWFRGNYGHSKTLTSSENEELNKSYQNALLLVSSRSEFGEYDDFLYKMKKRMSKAPFKSNVYERVHTRNNITKYSFNITVSMSMSLCFRLAVVSVGSTWSKLIWRLAKTNKQTNKQ